MFGTRIKLPRKKILNNVSVSRATVFQWHSRFVAGEKSNEDTEWSRRQGTTRTNENITRVGAVLKDDCRATCRKIVENTGYQKKLWFTKFFLMI